MRPHQWVKNVLVALPSVADHSWHPAPVAVAFGCFCLCSSSMYLLNDVLDADHDRGHPRKRSRPVASGAVRDTDAVILAIVLAVIAFYASTFFSWRLGIVIVGYLTLASVYTLWLKHLLMVDVVTLAILYGLRVIGGSAVTGWPPWPARRC